MSGRIQGGADAALLQVVIVSFECRDRLLAALEALQREAGLPLELTVVDNASSDGTVAAVRERHPGVRMLANDRNVGFAAGCNQGWRGGAAGLVLFLNPDAEVLPGALEALTELLQTRPEVGVVGPRTRNADGTVQVSTGKDLRWSTEIAQRRLVKGVSRRLPRALAEADRLHAREHEPDWVSGACLMTRRACLEAVGGFDEGFFLYEEDADLCRRLRAGGWRVLFTPAAEVRHRLGESMARDPRRSRLEYHRSHLRYYAKHAGLPSRAALRLLLAARGALGWLRGALRGDRARRGESAALLRVALGREG